MALPLASTFQDLRRRLAVRLELGKQAETNATVRDLLSEYLRTAFHLLVREADWAILVVRRTMSLTNAEHTYDVPDDIEVGGIHQISVLNTSNHEYPLQPGVSSYERSAYRIDRGGETDTDQASLPLRWTVENGNLVIYPAPDTSTYPTLVIYGKARPRTPFENDDRANVDDEALLLGAEVVGKEAMGKSGARNAARMYERHLRNLRAAQSDGELVQIGPTRSRRYATASERDEAPDHGIFYPDFDPFHPFFR
jgi:hypothetical protein